jgi:hypothetical protein
MDFDQLPIEWQEKVRELRSDSSRYRIERNRLRQVINELPDRYCNDRELFVYDKDGDEILHICGPKDRPSRGWFIDAYGVNEYNDKGGGVTPWDEIGSMTFGAGRSVPRDPFANAR